MDVITIPKICKPSVVYRFYCMALFHSQTQRYMINRDIILSCYFSLLSVSSSENLTFYNFHVKISQFYSSQRKISLFPISQLKISLFIVHVWKSHFFKVHKGKSHFFIFHNFIAHMWKFHHFNVHKGKFHFIFHNWKSPFLKFTCDCLFVCLFCCFTSKFNSNGNGGTVSSPNHTFSWACLNKQLTSTSCTYFRS